MGFLICIHRIKTLVYSEKEVILLIWRIWQKNQIKSNVPMAYVCHLNYSLEVLCHLAIVNGEITFLHETDRQLSVHLFLHNSKPKVITVQQRNRFSLKFASIRVFM